MTITFGSMRILSGLSLALVLLLGLLFWTGSVQAQPSRPDAARPDRGARPPHPLLAVFDTDRDGTLTRDEIAAASAVLRAFDQNGDGQLSDEELLRALPPPEHRERGPMPRGE